MKRRKFKKISKNIYKVENVFPDKVAEKIFFKFNNLRSKSWKLVSQKKNHYSHVFKNSSEFLPDKDEVYLAKFYRSDELRNNSYIKFYCRSFIWIIWCWWWIFDDTFFNFFRCTSYLCSSQ